MDMEECFDGCQVGGRGLGEWVKRWGDWEVQNSHVDVKYGIGNGLAKELIHTTMDMDNGVGIAWGSGGCWVQGGNRRKIGTTVIV